MIEFRKDGSHPRDRLVGFDFARHNADVAETMASYNAGAPKRTPIILGTNSRYFMGWPDANPQRIGFRGYSEDPDVMFDALLRFQRWSRFNLLQDAELGLPERWQITVDFQNYYEAAWLGCPVIYIDDQVPDTRPAFTEQPERVMEQGMPGPFDGLMARGLEYYQRFQERAKREPFLGRRIEIVPPTFGTGTDGAMTIACNLFGAEFVCEAMANEPKRLHRLLEFVTDAVIVRLTAWRKLLGLPVRQDGFNFADDSIALISTAMYREHVLPYHLKLCDALATDAPRAIHLCGDASRHFKTLRDELNIETFDTGFPIDFGKVRRELGPRVRIQGGPSVEVLRSASPRAVREETRRILQSGVLEGGLFVLREANNLAPHTPLENTEAMYHAGREFGFRGK